MNKEGIFKEYKQKQKYMREFNIKIESDSPIKLLEAYELINKSLKKITNKNEKAQPDEVVNYVISEQSHIKK